MEEQKSEDSEVFTPGAAQYGNFINYYEFNPPSNRLSLFKKSSFSDFLFSSSHHQQQDHVKATEDYPLICCLDIGCNTGELSRGLCEMLSSSDKSSHVASASSAAVHMLGVDLDCQLVERAREMSSGLQLMATDYSLSFETLNVVTEAEKRDQMWRSYLTARNRSRFDVVFCFSTTMWVHLNHGDAGLEDLLTCLARWADNVIVEPQPWKCYRNATRRLRRAQRQDAFPLFNSLVHRSNVLDHINNFFTTKLGMHLHAHLGNSEWNRPVWWFRHTPALPKS